MAERRPIAGFEGIYEASADGDVFSLARAIPTEGRGTRQVREQKLSPTVDAKGYLLINLHKDGVSHIRYVHRLILEAFLGPCPEGHRPRWRDGDRTNNALSNLYWGPQLEAEAAPVAPEATPEAPAPTPTPVRRRQARGWEHQAPEASGDPGAAAPR